MKLERKILKRLKETGQLSDWWQLKDFMIIDYEDKIVFSYSHGDMGIVDKIIYDKKDQLIEVYDLDNYFGNTYLRSSLYLESF